MKFDLMIYNQWREKGTLDLIQLGIFRACGCTDLCITVAGFEFLFLFCEDENE